MAYYGGHFVYDEEEGPDADKYYGLYDLETKSEWFFSRSNTRRANTKNGCRQRIKSMLNNELKDTYFGMLPYEMIELIFTVAKRLSQFSEREFYQEYFNIENTQTQCIRYLRLSKEQKKFHLQGELHPDISWHHFSHLGLEGSVLRRTVYGFNDASMCFKDLSKCIEMGVNSCDGISLLYTNVINWFIWICDHSYLACWRKLMITMIKKTFEFDDKITELMILVGQNKSIDTFREGEDLNHAKKIVKDMCYFISNYTPYVLLTRNDIYYEELEISRGGRWMGGSYGTHDTVYELLSLTNTSLYDIQHQDCYEYEMALYAPDYFYNTYEKYKRLRSGKVIIPAGRIPKFYWLEDRYINSFV
jgi:hypothetical protein